MSKFQVGVKVAVIDGVIDPDLKISISGWSGTVQGSFLWDEDHQTELCTVVWDKKTAAKMGKALIDRCDRENLDHTEMNLAADELYLHTSVEKWNDGGGLQLLLKYTNRSGKNYFLRQGVTTTGKPRYFFSSKEEGAGERVTDIPDGYEIYEKPENGQVFLKKAVPQLINESEAKVVKQHLATLNMPFRYLTDCKDKCITVYESNLNEDCLKSMADNVPAFRIDKSEALKKWCTTGSFSGVLRFSLSDLKKRTFTAERLCYRSFRDNWIYLDGPDVLDTLAEKYVSLLGTEEFYQTPYF